jgi:CheY-like chemotaxis protein
MSELTAYEHKELKSEISALVALVVEDEWLLRADLASELEKSGWKVLEASTGERALQQLQAGEPVHLLITDIRLAGNLSGWDVAEAFRLVKPDLPIIYMSGNFVDMSRKVAGSVFLGKPCAPAKILETSRDLLQTDRS